MDDKVPPLPASGTQVETAARMLDATLDAVRELGLRRLTLEDVASRAGVSRQTLYRYFGSRDQLMEAVILREERFLLARVEEAVAASVDFEDAVRLAVRTVVRAAREHPLLDRLLTEEPGALLPYLALGKGPVVSAAEPVVRELLVRFLADSPSAHIDAMAHAATRLIASYALAPDEDPDAAADTIAVLLARGAAGHSKT